MDNKALTKLFRMIPQRMKSPVTNAHKNTIRVIVNRPDKTYPAPTPITEPKRVRVLSAQAKPTKTPTPTPTPTPDPDYGELFAQYFPKDVVNDIPRVLQGENAGRDPMAENVNRDGSIDRGIFQINSNTFADFMRRKKDLLNKHGIYTYEDMYDPEKNIAMASIIFDEQGWGAWYGAPDDLRNS